MTFQRGDAVDYSGPFVNMRGRCTFLTECKEHGAIESVYISPDTLKAAAT